MKCSFVERSLVNADNSQTLLFVHVPKTAGRTIDSVLRRQYEAEEIYGVGKDIQGDYNVYIQMDPAERARFRVMLGHIPYGVHEYISGPFAYFTFLRDPIERTISHYYFLRRETDHPLADKLKGNWPSLEKCLELELDGMMFNAQTRLLSGVSYDALPGKCTTEHLELAKEKLRLKFSVIGLTERFDESLILLKEAFGWSDIRYYSRNVTRGRPRKEDLPASTRDALESANLLDLELYAYGQERFTDQIRGRERQLAFAVLRLRLANYLKNWNMPTKQRSVRVYVKERWRRRS